MGELHWIDGVIIIVYFLSMIGIGLWTARKIKTQRDFFAAGRNLSPFIMVMLGYASSTNPDQIVAVAAQSFPVPLRG